MADAADMLMAVPNVSEGRDRELLARLPGSFAPARFVDLHADADHGGSVFTLAGPQGELAEGLVAGARAFLDQTVTVGTARVVGSLGEEPRFHGCEHRRTESS